MAGCGTAHRGLTLSCGSAARCGRAAAEHVGRHHLVGARPRQRDLDAVDDAAGPRRHHQHLVGEIDRLGQAVGDEHHGLARGATRCAAARGPWSCASARRAPRTARPSAAPAGPAPGRARSRRAASCRRTARAGSARRSPRRPTRLSMASARAAALLARRAAQAERKLDVVERVSQGNRLASWKMTPTRSGSGVGIGAPWHVDRAVGLVAQTRPSSSAARSCRSRSGRRSRRSARRRRSSRCPAAPARRRRGPA